MSEPRYDILFAGELADGADAAVARARLKAMFKLGDDAVERLFSGRLVTIKRDASEEVTTRYRDAFREFGARIRVHRIKDEEAAQLGLSTAQSETDDKAEAKAGEPDEGGFSLAPPGTLLDEIIETLPERPIDISYLSLVTDPDWSLEDCEPPLPPIMVPDIDHLTLVAIEPPKRSEDDF